MERLHLPYRDPSTLQEFTCTEEKEEAAHVAVLCHSTVEIWDDFLSSSQFYVLVPDHGDNYICVSEVPGDGLPGTLGNSGCLEGTHHLMGDLQALPGVLMAPSQFTHTDPSMTGDLPELETPVWAQAGVSLGLSCEAETAPGSLVTQRFPSPLDSRKQALRDRFNETFLFSNEWHLNAERLYL